MNRITNGDVLALVSKLDIEIDADELDPAKPLNMQGLDSLDMMDLFFAIEKEYSVSIGEDADMAEWESVEKIVLIFNNRFCEG